jgi:hypothetical protein
MAATPRNLMDCAQMLTLPDDDSAQSKLLKPFVLAMSLSHYRLASG